MRKLFLALAGTMMIAGSSFLAPPAMALPAPTAAAPSNNLQKVQYYRHDHRRPVYRNRHHRRVCRTVVRNKIVWRNHRRHLERYRTRVCNWR